MKSYAVVDALGREEIDNRLMRYLGSWPQGLSTARMRAWIHSCTKFGGYSVFEYEAALKRLRDSGRIAIACGIWYLRKQ